MPRRPSASFRAADLLKQVMVQDVALSPDGSSVVYARRTIEKGAYRKRLWRVAFEGGEPERLTSSDGSDGAPRFSPDGKSLLFLSDRSGQTQPWAMSLGGGEPRRVAEIEGEVRAAEWSPDGKRVAMIAPSGVDRFLVGKPDDPVARRITDITWRLDGIGIRDRFNSAWVVRAAGGRPTRVVAPDFEVTEVFWSPDGARLGFLADLGDNADIIELPQAWTVDPKGRDSPRALAALKGSVYKAAWSPEGVLAMLGMDHPADPEWANESLFLLDDDGLHQLGGGLDVSFTVATYGDLVDPDAYLALCWSDARHLVALGSRLGASLPFRFSRDGEVEQLVDGDIVCSDVAAVGDRVVVVASERGAAGEVYAVEDNGLRRLTRAGRWLERWRRDPERHRVAHPEGHSIDAWLVPARGRRSNRPMVLHIHGGPHASHGPTPWLEMLALADAGMHVLYPNPRGSKGYGEAFARALHGRWGEPDSSDVEVLIDWAVGEGLTMHGRIGVLGLSYGGYLVNWLLGHHPGLFAAGVSENPVTDMVSEFGEADLGIMTDQSAVGAGRLPDDLDEFLRRSPFVEMGKSRAPLLFLQAEADLRCPPGQSELVFTMLRLRGATVEMVRYPNESHYLVGAGRPDRRVDRIERIVEWLARHLAAGEGGPPP